MAAAERAIYIDFEGPDLPKRPPIEERHPTLVGVLVEQEWDQMIVDSDFFEIADYEGGMAFPCRAGLLTDEHEALVERCLAEDRFLVAFGEHEYRMFEVFGDSSLLAPTAAVYVDAEPLLRKGWNAASTTRHALNFYRLKYGLDPLPPHLKGKKTGGWISGVRQSVKAPSNLGRFGPRASSAKGKWTKLRQRNERDCWDLRTMLIEVAVRLQRRR